MPRTSQRHGPGRRTPPPPPLPALLLALVLLLAPGSQAARSLRAAAAPAPAPLDAPSGTGFGDGQCGAAAGMLAVAQPVVYDAAQALLQGCAAAPADCLALAANATVVVAAALSGTLTLGAAEAVLDGEGLGPALHCLLSAPPAAPAPRA